MVFLPVMPQLISVPISIGSKENIVINKNKIGNYATLSFLHCDFVCWVCHTTHTVVI